MRRMLAKVKNVSGRIGIFSLDITVFRQTHTGEPSGGITSTAEDMAKWVQFHLNEGSLTPEGKELLPSWVLANTYYPNMLPGRGGIYKPKFPVSLVNIAYGMGWRTSVYRGE